MSFHPKPDVSDALERVSRCDILLAPAPGTCGNVGQLACDVLALNLNLSRVGVVDFEHLIPVCGRDALYDDVGDGDVAGALASACEVYVGEVDFAADAKARETRTVVVAQIRSDANIGARRLFCEEYVNFLTTFAHPERVVLLSSLPSTYGASAAQIGGTKWRRCGGDDEFKSMCVANDLIELEENVYPPSEEIAESVDPHWALVDTIGTNTRVGCVVAVCSEGDNSVDGAGMALAAARACGIDVGTEPKAPVPGATYIGPWRVPRSWEGAFGLRQVSRDMFS